MNIDVYNGPNLNMLGERDPGQYGTRTLEDINRDLEELAGRLEVEVASEQTNSEGTLVDWIQSADADGFILNPGGLTHTSVSLRDAIEMRSEPVVEVHLSNIHGREEFRRRSMISPVCLAQVAGFGPSGYKLALRGLVNHLRS